MIIELPKEFTFFNEIGEEVAYIDGRGILKLKSVAAFRKVMFEIAYEMKGRNRCCYCGKTVESNRMTIDHMYPQDFGGPTITNNLLLKIPNLILATFVIVLATLRSLTYSPALLPFVSE